MSHGSNLSFDKPISEQMIIETESMAENYVNMPLTNDEIPEENTDSSANISQDSERNITNILNLGEFENFDVTSPQGIGYNASTSFKNQKHNDLKNRSKHVKKRKWRPLWKLTQKEFDKVNERAGIKYHREKEELIAAGVAFAPHNTSEFLIDDRGVSSYDDEEYSESAAHEHETRACGANLREFNELYESVGFQIHEDCSKHELVQLWINAEDRNEALEKEITAIRERKQMLGISIDDIESQMTKIEVFKEEIAKLKIKNDELSRRNERLRKHLNNRVYNI